MTNNQTSQAATLLDRLQLAIERKLDDVVGDLQADLALLEEQIDGIAAALKQLAEQVSKK